MANSYDVGDLVRVTGTLTDADGDAADPNTITQAARTASLLILALVVWLQVALGHIFRHALEVTLLLGVGLAFLYSVVSENVIRALFVLPGGL